ncbi:hypothetical protein GIB67_008685 [Kingdonia uniflora]|uniref:Alkaline/neutral invertase n=1 Tax=Kingdonia uniflora TaxID=39325 RepID=A0A7J7M5B3_9MAGN|nr:hypothetical protein GIB67_008685 [Kingdonia uniflora]
MTSIIIRLEKYSHTAVNKFNVIPDSLPDWVFDFMPVHGGYYIENVSLARMDFRWFCLGNCIAILSSLATPEQSVAIMDLIESRWEELVGEMPLKIAVKEIIAKNLQSKYLDVNHDHLAQVFGKVKKGCVNFMSPDVTKKFIQSIELLGAQIMEGKESYIDLENQFSQYKADNDVKLDSLRDMVTSLRVATPAVNIDRSRISTPLLREETVAHFLNLHKHIMASGCALVIPGYQESDEVEYEVLPVVGFLTFLDAHKGLKMLPILGFVIPNFCGCL